MMKAGKAGAFGHANAIQKVPISVMNVGAKKKRKKKC